MDEPLEKRVPYFDSLTACSDEAPTLFLVARIGQCHRYRPKSLVRKIHRSSRRFINRDFIISLRTMIDQSDIPRYAANFGKSLEYIHLGRNHVLHLVSIAAVATGNAARSPTETASSSSNYWFLALVVSFISHVVCRG